NIKVEILSNNFDGYSISKLSHYVIEVVNNLINMNKCWFTVLNANVLMDDVSSLVVRKFELPEHVEKYKRFENEIEDFSVALFKCYLVLFFK
ncbi:hypothetical protein MXB_2161, partial [Myxobolus squamalis]